MFSMSPSRHQITHKLIAELISLVFNESFQITLISKAKVEIPNFCVPNQALLAKFKLRNRIRTIEYEGVHLVCFGCGIYGHRQENCTKKKSGPVQNEGGAREDQVGAGNGMAASKQSAVNGEESHAAQIRKEIVEGGKNNASFGPWRLAKKGDNKYGKARFTKTQGKGKGGKKERNKEANAKNHARKVNNDNEIGVSSRYNALFGLGESDEEVGNGHLNGLDFEEEQSAKEKNQNEEVLRLNTTQAQNE